MSAPSTPPPPTEAPDGLTVSLVAQISPVRQFSGAPFEGDLAVYAEQLVRYFAENISRFADPRGADVFLTVVVQRGEESQSQEFRSGHYVDLARGPQATVEKPDGRERCGHGEFERGSCPECGLRATSPVPTPAARLVRARPERTGDAVAGTGLAVGTAVLRRVRRADAGMVGQPTRGSGQNMSEARVPVLYLDIDGTVREGKDDPLGRFVNTAADVRVFPEALVMMRRWKDGGGRIAGVSNQGGIALGIVTELQVAAAMVETQGQCEGLFDLITFCKHHPDAQNPEMARCWCRKPSAGAVVEAAHGLVDRHPGEIYPPYMGLFVGDREEDEACAASAGLDFEWAAAWRARAR